MPVRRWFLSLLAAVALLAGAVALPGQAIAAPPGSESRHGPGTGLGAAPDGSRVVAVQQVADRQVDLTIDSVAMGSTEKVRLLTPDGWSLGSRHRWPTLWLLHGCCGDYTSWTAAGGVADIAALHKVLVVMPEAGNDGFYSNWKNGAYDWETFHLREVLPIVEGAYGASSDRTVAGLSMGGFGAVSYTARHPGAFRATASFSGLVDTRLAGAPENIQGFLARYGDDPDGLWGDPVADARTWAAHNPTDLAWRLRNQPLFLSVGNGEAGPYDTPGSYDANEHLYGQENAAFAAALQRVHARHVVTDFYGPGQHKWTYWHRELVRSLPMLLRAMGVRSR